VPIDGEDAADLRFTLWDAESEGTQVGSANTYEEADFDQGRFTVLLDFGAEMFNGQARWLQVAVRVPPGEGHSYTTLSPRQELTPAPYALALPGIRTVQHTTSPNVVGGHSNNTVAPDVWGAVIAGGGDAGLPNEVTANLGAIGGGQANRVSGDGGVVGGGFTNEAGESSATVAGGYGNLADGNYACVGGGWSNSAAAYAATVAGGYYNQVIETGGTVGGGQFNSATAHSSTVSGGEVNNATGDYATVGGGWWNDAAGELSVIGGGRGHDASGYASSLGGGEMNAATGNHATVSGGYRNDATAEGAFIGGGQENNAGGQYACVPGGRKNFASADYSFAAGRRAKANHDGAFVWADATDADFASTASNQFAVRASGGVNLYVRSSYSDQIGGGLRITPPLAPDNDGNRTPNVIGGYQGNIVNANVVGATLSGGGAWYESYWVNGEAPNKIFDHFCTVAGGWLNKAGTPGSEADDATNATVSGGAWNVAGAWCATVAGGLANWALNSQTTIGGGGGNRALGEVATVAGGGDNIADGDYSAIGGGGSNTAEGIHSNVSGGQSNGALGDHATVGGGLNNEAGGYAGSIGGGENNTAAGEHAIVAGGYSNDATGQGTFIGGGLANSALGPRSTIAGGEFNLTPGGEDGWYAAIGGGSNNEAGVQATVSGGFWNKATACYSTIPGGGYNQAGGDYSLAAGRRAKVRNATQVGGGDTDGDEGTFLWADSTDADLTSSGPNQFLIRASGGVGVNTNAPAHQLDVNGTIRAAGTGAAAPIFIIHDSNGSNDRPGIQFTNNSMLYICGDDGSDENFGFYSVFGNTRTYGATLTVHGPATGSWGKYIRLRHDGTDGIIDTDAGDLVLSPAGGNVGIGTADPTAKLHIGGTAGTDGLKFPDGTLQTTASRGLTAAAVSVDPPSLTSGAATTINVTVTGAATGDAVIANPGANLPDGYGITFTRVSAANTITIGFINGNASSQNPAASTWAIRIIK